MNSCERMRAALRCQAPDRIPKALAFWEESLPAIAPASPSDYFGLDVRFAQFKQPAEQTDFLDYLSTLPPDVHVGSLAQLKTYHDWNYHPERAVGGSPLDGIRSIEDLEHYIFPDFATPDLEQDLASQTAFFHARGLAVAGSPPHLGGELFETAYRLRGFDNFLADLKHRQPLARYLLDQLAALSLQASLTLARAGVDILLLDDDVAMPTDLIIAPGTWREFFKPRLAGIIRLAREIAPDLLVFYHSDGNFSRLVPDLVEIGVNVIHPVQPDCMDAPAIKEAFGERLALWGTVGTAWLWDHGTPEQIREEVKLRIDQLGPEGLVLAPAYDTDFTPFRNLVAFYEAVEAFGS